MISKWLRLLRPKFETTQRNLFFKKSFLEGNLSQVSKMPNVARLQVHMHKLSSHLGSLGPGCVFYLQNRWKETSAQTISKFKLLPNLFIAQTNNGVQ